MGRRDWDLVRRALDARAPSLVRVPFVKRAAVAVVLRERDSDLEALFIRRAEHPKDPWSGQMAFPGGRAEPGDADLAATAVRETREETSLDLERDGTRLGALDELQAMARMRPVGLAISPYVFRCDSAAEAAPSAEVRSTHWIALGDLLRPEHHSFHPYRWAGVTLRFPCLRLPGEIVIWGLTYRMFEGFAERLAAADAHKL